jgi:hypothetical protein
MEAANSQLGFTWNLNYADSGYVSCMRHCAAGVHSLTPRMEICLHTEAVQSKRARTQGAAFILFEHLEQDPSGFC